MFSFRGILFIVVLLGGTIWSFKKPLVCFMGLALIIVNQIILYESLPQILDTFHTPLLTLSLLLITNLLHSNYSRLSRSSKRKVLLLFLFLIACFVSRLSSDEIMGHKYMEEISFAFLAFLGGISCIKTEKDTKQYLVFLVVIIIWSALLAYYNYKVLGWVLPVPSMFHTDRNEYAGMVVSILPLVATLIIITPLKFIKIFLAGCMLVLIACGVASYSRGAFLTVVLALIFMYRILPYKKTYIFLCIVLIIVASFRLSASFHQRIETTTQYKEEGSSAGRIATYIAAWDMLKDNPLMGVGVGNFNDQFWEYCPEEYRHVSAPGKSIHNIYLQALAETGVLGFVPFFWFVVSCMWPVTRRAKTTNKEPPDDFYLIVRAVQSSFVLLCFNRFFLPGAYDIYFFIFASFVFSAKAAYQQIELEPNKKKAPALK